MGNDQPPLTTPTTDADARTVLPGRTVTYYNAPEPTKNARASIIVSGGRTEHETPARGWDIAVRVVVDGVRTRLPVTSCVLRIEGPKAVATLEVEVDEVEIEGIGDVSTMLPHADRKRLDDALAVLNVLDNRGGLGFDYHEMIRAVTKGKR